MLISAVRIFSNVMKSSFAVSNLSIMSHVVHVIQMKLHLKMIIMISLSTHMMASQGRMCAECVRNGFHTKEI